MEIQFSQTNTKEKSASGYASFFKSSILKCSKTMLAFLFTLFFAGNLLAQSGDFVTKWDLATSGSGATQLSFGVETNGTVSYSWAEVSPGTASGSGTFSGSTLTITGLPTGATIRLRISPTNFQGIIVNGGTDKDRLTNVEQWGTTAWTSMENAFKRCGNLNISSTDVPNLSSLTKVDQMFQGCSILNGPSNIGSWNVSGIGSFVSMFNGCYAFNQNISSWNTASAGNMTNMFNSCYVFNQDISGWNTANVNSMWQMFQNASVFNQNLGNWTLKSGVDLDGMLKWSGLDCAHYEATLIGWNSQSVTGISLAATGLKYGSSASAARNSLTTTKSWTITGDNSSSVCDQLVTKWNLATTGSGANQLRILTGNSGTVSYSWEEVSPGTANGSGTFTTTGASVAQTISGLPTGATIRLRISPTNLTRFAVTTSGGADNKRLLDVEQWGSTAWGNLENAFIATDLTNISAFGIPNLSSITKMENMFEGCRKLLNITNIGSWNVSTATTMTSMFKDCYKFNQDISGWNTANVTSMQNMLGSAKDFNQNLGNWTLKSGVNLTGMLSNCGMDCSNYTATLIGWSTQSVTGRTLGATGRTYAPSLAARASLTTATGSGGKGWTITGDAVGTCSAPPAPYQQSPFTIIDFGGFTKNNIVNLEWIVTDENDLSRYDVYSSTDGINFSLCGSVTATMAERGLKTYQFQDLSNKAALVYYRIKAINNDETGEWSSTVAINTNKSVVNKPLKVYPNPATDFINLEFDGIDASNFNVLVMDMSGKVVYKLDGVQTAINQYTLPLNGIESGMYVVQLSDKFGNTTINRFNINQ